MGSEGGKAPAKIEGHGPSITDEGIGDPDRLDASPKH
jgi:hypothetical protein